MFALNYFLSDKMLFSQSVLLAIELNHHLKYWSPSTQERQLSLSVNHAGKDWQFLLITMQIWLEGLFFVEFVE